MKLKVCVVGVSLALAVPAMAFAQTTTDTNASGNADVNVGVSGSGTKTNTTTLGPANQQPLPPPQSFHEEPPPVAAPAARDVGVTEQAGIGGTQAYGRAGVLELGGSAGFAAAKDYTQLNISPSVGWFFVDNFEISGIVGVNYIHTGGQSGTLMTYLAEPSYHLPFSNRLFGFLGVGAGLAYQKDAGAGFALAPRLGMNVLVGRSGILTPALQLVYNTTEVTPVPQGTAVAVNTTYGANIGYTVMW
jgi:hypothetical protein